MTRNIPQRVQLILRIPEFKEPQADGIQRLRRLLKCLLRSYGLKAESVEPLPPHEEPKE
ncbi:MAG: hypothetical protein ACK5YR_12340 [Pirellula sp.]